MFRNKHPYFLFTYSKILHCFIHRKHIFFPNWNLTFFNFNRHSSLLLFSLDKTLLSAHDNLQFYTLSSADKITIQVAVQYSAHIGFAPSLNMTRFFLEVSLSQICFVALCSCYTFCQILLAPYLYFNVIFQHFLVFTPLTEQIYHGGFT